MRKKVCIITGGNAGIGKEAAFIFTENNWKVFIACRNPEKARQTCDEILHLNPNADIHFIKMNLGSKTSITDGFNEFLNKSQIIDTIIHNAADFDISRQSPLYIDGVESVWGTNHIGPVFLNNLAIPFLKHSEDPRIITVSSKGLVLYPFLKINFNDPEFKSSKFSVQKAYYQSKLAQTMYTIWLSQKLKEYNIKVNCIRVTNVKIDLTRYPKLSSFQKFLYSIKSKFSISPFEMAKCYFKIGSDTLFAQLSGLHFDENNNFVSFPSFARSSKNIEKLMELTEKYL